MDCWNFAEVMQYIAYGGFVFVNLSALIRWAFDGEIFAAGRCRRRWKTL